MPNCIRLLVALCITLALPLQNSLLAQDQLARQGTTFAYRNAQDLLQKGQYAAARSAFEAIAAGGPDVAYSTEAQYQAAYCALVLFHGDGEAKMGAFIEAHPQHPKAKTAWFELGMFYYRDNQASKAITYLKRVNADDLIPAQRQELFYTLGYSYFSKRKLTEAAPLFDRLKISNNPYRYASSYYAGYIAYEQDRYEDALQDLKRAGESPDYSGKVSLMIATIYYRQGRNEELLAYAESEINNRRSGREQMELALLVAEAYFSQEQYPRALTYYEQYMAGMRKLPEPAILHKIAFSQYKNGQNQAAIDNFKVVALQKSPNGQEASYYLGILYAGQGNEQYALSAFGKAAGEEYNRAIKMEAAFQYAKMQAATGNYSLAIESLSAFTAQYPQSAHYEEANDLLGEAYLRTDNYAQAINHIESLPGLTPKLRESYQKVTYYQGTVLFNKARYFDAVQHFAKAQKYPISKQISLQAYYWSGEAYSIGKRWDDAINAYGAAFRQGQATDRDYFLRARYGIGYAYFNTRQYDKAQVHFKAYTEAKRNDRDRGYYEDALVRLADCYYAGKQYQLAISQYQQCVADQSPDADYALYQVGLIKGIITEYEEALSTLNRMIARYPQSRYQDEARFQKGQFLFEQGKYREAINSFDDLLQNYNSSPSAPFALISKAISHGNLQEQEQTISSYGQFLNNYPAHPKAQTALLGLQQALNAANRGDELEPYLARFKQANPGDQAVESVEYEAAKALYFNQSYQRAANSLQRYIETYPESINLPEARFYLAEAFYRLDQPEQAEEAYRWVITDNSSNWVNRALLRLGTIQFENAAFAESLSSYEQLANQANNKKEVYYGLSGMMESHYQLGNYEEVSSLASRILAEAAVTTNAENKAQLYIAKALFAKGDYNNAIDELLIVLNAARDVHGAEAQYLLGEIYYLQKAYQQSLETLYDLNKTFGAYDYWLGKSFLLIADNFIALEEYFQAKETLKSVVEKSAEAEIVELAKTKLQELETIEADLLQKESATDSLAREQPQAAPDSTSIEQKNEVKKQ